MSTDSDDALESWIREVLEREFEVPPEAIRPQAHLRDDLGLESLDLVDLVLEFERHVGRRIENEELKGLETVGDIHALLARMGTGRAAG